MNGHMFWSEKYFKKLFGQLCGINLTIDMVYQLKDFPCVRVLKTKLGRNLEAYQFYLQKSWSNVFPFDTINETEILQQSEPGNIVHLQDMLSSKFYSRWRINWVFVKEIFIYMKTSQGDAKVLQQIRSNPIFFIKEF